MRRPLFSILFCAVALSNLTISCATAADFRELNHHGIEAMRAGDYERSQRFFQDALSAYESEPTGYDKTIRSNLNILQAQMQGANERTNTLLSGRVSHSQSIVDFVQPIFNKEATKRLHRDVSISNKFLKMVPENDSVIAIQYGQTLKTGLLELNARVLDMGNGTFKLLAISSNLFEPTSLNATASLFKEDDASKKAAIEKNAQKKDVEKSPEPPVAAQPNPVPVPPAASKDAPPVEQAPEQATDQATIASQSDAPATPEQQAAAAQAVATYQSNQPAVPKALEYPLGIPTCAHGRILTLNDQLRSPNRQQFFLQKLK